MKKLLTLFFLLSGICIADAQNQPLPSTTHSEVMAWSNITGIRQEGELIDFESSLRAGSFTGWMEATGRERQQNVRYRREGQTQIVDIPLHCAHFHQEVTDVDMNTVRLSWTAEADKTSDEGAYFAMSFSPKYYADAKIRISGNKVTVTAPERNLTLKFNKKVKSFARNEEGNQVLYVTLMPTLVEGNKCELSATLTVGGKHHHEEALIELDMNNPGARFAGFGGNFRIQDYRHDPDVIDYCLKNMRVAFGRVELPWAKWENGGKDDVHVAKSAEMAARLKEIGMPLVVSCWFPPEWALIPGQKKARPGVAALRLDPSKKERIYDSLASYLVYLKKEFGVEADYFSFNESDIGIDVLHTPQEHCDFIKEFGAKLASLNLSTKLLLGDNSDATDIDFIKPALADKDAHRYIGAISFHSWRGCDDAKLQMWHEAALSINVPLLVGEGSTDAAAHRYKEIFKESTFALYEINLYTRLCAICQPISILQWQLTSDYSLVSGHGVLGDDGPIKPTQRFYNLKQLSLTPADAFAIPVSSSKDNVNVAAFCNIAQKRGAVHAVNNGASCEAVISGLPSFATHATVYVTNRQQNAEQHSISISDGQATISMPAESFISVVFD